MVVAGGAEAHVVIGPRAVVEDADEAACGLLGYSRGELVGLHGSELIAPEERARVAVSIDRMQRGALDRRAGAVMRKDGTTLAVDVRATQLPGGRLELTLSRRDEPRR
jgi:PAS domain S-box-containing protein